MASGQFRHHSGHRRPFYVFFLGLPQSLPLFSCSVPTHLVLMGIFLTLCTIMVTVGGQISVMLSDCAQGMISQIFFVIITIALLAGFFSWSDTSQNVLGHEFIFNGMQIAFFASGMGFLVYLAVSWLTCRQPHNMDQLLHRGQYAVEPEAAGEGPHAASRRVNWLYRIIGIDEHFNRMDRWTTIGIFVWSMFWFVVFLVGTAVYLIHPWSDRAWANYWLMAGIFLPLLVGVATTVWFTIGCWHDLRVFFRRLREESVDLQDDGSVPHDH